MNVYDFDKTIYKNDSTADFYLFCLKRHPSVLLLLPSLIYALLLWGLGKLTKTEFKERFYRFLTKIPDINEELELFWDKNEHKIKAFYLKNQKDDDVVISASPEFLLKPICKRLGINHLQASRVDKYSGKYDSLNCWGAEKVSRFYLVFDKNAEIEEFYSDSLSDTPLANISKTSYIVLGENLLPWQDYEEKSKNKPKFFSHEFMLFLVIGCINTFNSVFFSWLYSHFINPNAAFALGYVTSLVIAYVLNSKINFKKKLSPARLVKFCLSYVPNFIIQNAIVFLLYNLLALPKLVAYFSAAVIGIPLTFVCVKLFAFGK